MLTKTVEPRHDLLRRQGAMTPEMSLLLRRVRSEYLEMPGLKLTEAQARRLWSLDGDTCRLVMAILIERGFLRRSARGTYVRSKG